MIVLIALFRKVSAYEAFLAGCKEGILYFYNLFPNLLAMFFAVTLLRESGMYELIARLFVRLLPNIPSPLVPLMLTRPLSGTASLALLTDLLQQYHPDSLIGLTASVIQSATDTTVYVISLYFGHIQVKKIRNSLKISLCADVIGISLAVLLSAWFWS